MLCHYVFQPRWLLIFVVDVIANAFGLVLESQNFFVQADLLPDIGDEFLLFGVPMIEESLVIFDFVIYELRFGIEGFGSTESFHELLPQIMNVLFLVIERK